VNEIASKLLILVEALGADTAAAKIKNVGSVAETSQGQVNKAGAAHSRFGRILGAVGGIAKTAAGVAGIAAVTLSLGEAFKATQDMQRASFQLGNSIKQNVHFPTRDALPHLTEYADRLATQGGFDPATQLSGLAQLVRVTGDLGKAQRDNTLATEIARGTGRNYASGLRALTMIENGRGSSLARMGINVPKVTAAEDKLRDSHVKANSAMREAAKQADLLATKRADIAYVTQHFAGATAAYSRSSVGQINNLKNTVEELAVSLGRKLLKPLGQAAHLITQFIAQIREHRGAGGEFVKILSGVAKAIENIVKWLQPLLPLVAALTAAWIAYNVVMAIYEGLCIAIWTAQIALNAALDANPVTLVVIAIIVLVAAFLLLWKHCKAFRVAVTDAFHTAKRVAVDAFHWIKQAGINVFNWFKAHWPLLIAIITAPFGGLVVYTILKHWKQIKRSFSDLWDWIKQQWSKLGGWLVWPFAKAWEGIKWFINKMIDGLNWVIKQINSVFRARHINIGPLHATTPGIHIQPLGHLAAGGDVIRSGPYLVGERGPEVVTLPRGAHVTSNEALAGATGQDRPIVIYNILDGKVMSKSVIRQGLLQQSRA
jgi:hypothetical protein